MTHRDLILVERADWGTIRVIIFSHDENGAKFVRDIYQEQFCYDLGRMIYVQNEHCQCDVHEPEGVDFGRATNPAVRLQKILDHLMRLPFETQGDGHLQAGGVG